MENLVSHEAMVKEIKNLCWDNRYREGMTVEHLAEELDALAEDFDPYKYRDNLLGDDNYIDEIIYDLMMEDTSMNIWNFFKWLLKKMKTTALLQKSSWIT